jgi:outer membrane lipoprotein-sorting protein
MKAARRFLFFAALALPLLLSGCFFFRRIHHLPIPEAPSTVLTVTPEQLVAQLNRRWDTFTSLTATVDIQATQFKSEQGVAKEYTTFRANILMRKPGMLRVYGRVPVIGTEMFDMASDGENFTLYIPHYEKAYEGPDALTKKSQSMLENLRPGFFYDAMAPEGKPAEDDYSVTADSVTVEDVNRKHLLLTPEYILNITRPNSGSHRLTPVRVITFHRSDLLPYEQDLYDSEGNLETHVTYSNYQAFGFGPYPLSITIQRRLENFQLDLSIEKITENMNLNNDQFVVKIPPGTKVQHLE